MQSIIINGVPAEHLNIMDRGLQYGDGLFETIACEQGALQFWNQHISRMEAGAKSLGITFPGEEKYYSDISNIIEPFLNEKCVIKLLLTRGQAERGYRQPRCPRPTRAVIITNWPEHPSEIANHGVNLCLCKQPVSINAALAGIKHLNRLDNVLARSEWDSEYHEGLMFDPDNNLIEGTMSNVFCIKNKTLLTPALDQAGINGIIRDQVLSIASENKVSVLVNKINMDDIGTMDEIFITNSIIGLWPVSSVGETRYAIGDMTRMIEAELKQRIKANEKTYS